MLGSFLSSYPTGSLLTELVQIYNGKYIVRACLQIEGVTRATAMAAAEILETAEDSARQRVITFFGATPTPQLQIPSENINTTKHLSIDSVHDTGANVIQVAPPVTVSSDSTPENNLEPNVETSQENLTKEIPAVEEVTTPSAKSKTKAETKTSKINTHDVSPFAEVTTKPENSIPNISASNQVPEAIPKPEPVSESLFNTYEELAATSPQLESSESKLPDFLEVIAAPSEFEIHSTALSNNINVAQDNYNQPEDIELPPVKNVLTTASTTAKRKKKAEPTDQSDDIAKIGVEMQRLGWTTEQGRDYLVKQYGKRSRHLLSADELRDFRQYLESQPTPDDPLAFDPIAGF